MELVIPRGCDAEEIAKDEGEIEEEAEAEQDDDEDAEAAETFFRGRHSEEGG